MADDTELLDVLKPHSGVRNEVVLCCTSIMSIAGRGDT